MISYAHRASLSPSALELSLSCIFFSLFPKLPTHKNMEFNPAAGPFLTKEIPCPLILNLEWTTPAKYEENGPNADGDPKWERGRFPGLGRLQNSSVSKAREN